MSSEEILNPLLKLPLELHTIVIQCIKDVCAQDLASRPPKPDPRNDDEEVQMDYEARMERKRVESIDTHFPWLRTLLALSSTCSAYRRLLAPEVFKIVFLRDSEISGKSVEALMRSEHKGHVQELRYAMFAAGRSTDDLECLDETYEGEELAAKCDELYPNTVDQVLRNLNSFPNLRTLSVEYAFNFNHFGGWDFNDHIYCCRDSHFPWELMVANSFEAIVANPPGTIEHLRLPAFMPVEVEIFEDSRWHQLLGRLLSFSLEMKHQLESDTYSMGMYGCFEEMAKNLDRWFWDHLNVCESFTLKCMAKGVLGQNDEMSQPHQLRPGQLPHLRNLHLEYLFIDADLDSFLTQEWSVLDSITLRNCICSRGIFTWSKIFKSLAFNAPKSVTKFEFSATRTSLWDQWEDNDPWPDPETAESRAVRQKLDAGCLVFPYAQTDGRYGDFWDHEPANREGLLSGNDQREYDHLMRVLQENKRKSKCSPVD